MVMLHVYQVIIKDRQTMKNVNDGTVNLVALKQQILYGITNLNLEGEHHKDTVIMPHISKVWILK